MITESQQTSSPDIEAYLAMQLLKDGDRHAAIDKCHEGISQYGPNRNLYLVKARAHLELEEYGFAQEALLSLLGLDPEHPAGWALLGEAYYQLGNMPKVDYCRNRLRQIFPTLTEPDEVEESNSADDASGQATQRHDDIPVGQDPCDPANIQYPVGQDPRGLDANPVGQADSRLDDFPENGQGLSEPQGFGPTAPALGTETRRHIDDQAGEDASRAQGDTASGIVVPEAQEDTPETNQSLVPLEEITESSSAPATPPEQSISEDTNLTGETIVDDLIESDLRIIEQGEDSPKLDLGIFETATFADICLAQGKYEKALEIYTKLLMIHPDNAEYREKINSIQAKMGSR
jgi:tetratricopeptide (TPR) repeat protein